MSLSVSIQMHIPFCAHKPLPCMHLKGHEAVGLYFFSSFDPERGFPGYLVPTYYVCLALEK